MLQDSTMDIYEELDRATYYRERRVFKEIMRRPEFDVNGKPGNPLLVVYADRSKPEWCMRRLIKAGADVNLCNISGKSPLYATLWSGRLDPQITRITIELMKRGADLNTVHQYNPNKSALYSAVVYFNVDLIYICLYYAANPYIRHRSDGTPLKLSLIQKLLSVEVLRVLVRFYDKSYFLNGPMEKVLSKSGNFIYMDCQGTALLAYSCNKKHYFKLLWHTFESMGILNEVVTTSLLSYYVKNSLILSDHWLDYLYLMLNVLCSSNGGDESNYFDDDFFQRLFKQLVTRHIKAEDCLIISSACLSLGAPINFDKILNVDHIYDKFFKTCGTDVADLFLYGCDRFLNVRNFLPCTLKYMFNGDVPKRGETESDPLEDGFKRKTLVRTVKSIPLLPTLVELSRDAARKFLKVQRLVSCPYHFLEIDRRLNLPKLIKDQISYKKPLYTRELKIKFINRQRQSRLV